MSRQSKQDYAIENGIGKTIISTIKFLYKSGKLFATIGNFLASNFLLGFKFLLGLAKNLKSSKTKLAKIFSLATLILASFLLGLTTIYIAMLSSNKAVSNNMLVASFFVFVVLLGFMLKTKIKISKYILAKKIENLNKNIRGRLQAINFKDSLARFPLLVARNDDGKYFEDYVFNSEIPLSSWVKNKKDIEEILNKRIINIVNDKNDTSMKIVKTTLLPEPMYVPFHSKYLSRNPYEIFLGLDIYGRPTYINLYKFPHAIVAGGTNTGKSTNAFSFFTQLKRHACNRIILCDFKGVTFKSLIKYNNNKPSIETKEKFVEMMKYLKEKNFERINLFKQFDDCENISEYNKLVDEKQKLKNIFVFIDELAMIMDKPDKELEELIKHIAQTGRSQGLYLIVFTQRPSAKTVPPEARANFMTRLSSFQPDVATSEMAIGDKSANELPEIVGRVVLKLAGKKIEVQAVHLKKEDLPKYLRVS